MPKQLYIKKEAKFFLAFYIGIIVVAVGILLYPFHDHIRTVLIAIIVSIITYIVVLHLERKYPWKPIIHV